MQRTEQIDAAARRLQRIKATLGMVAISGLDAGLMSVMEVNSLIQQEVNAALEELEAALETGEPALSMAPCSIAQPQAVACSVVEIRAVPRG